MQQAALERKKSFKRVSKKGSSSDYYSVSSRDDADQLPTFFFNCVTFLEAHALDEEGILRIHGRAQDTTAINAYLASGDSNTTLSQVDPHAVATLLKSYLCQGPPLLPMEHYSTLIEVGSKEPAEGVQSLREIILSSPLSFQRVLHRLLIFIDKVQAHSNRNKMDLRALSVIFNPVLLRAPTSVSPALILSQTQSCINCITLLLNHYQEIFTTLGLNNLETQLSPPVASRESSLPGSSARDKIKVGFYFKFSVKTGGAIRDTVSLFLKWGKQVITVKRRDSTGQTNALVCTNPLEVEWEEVIPLEYTIAFNKRLKVFETRNLLVSLKSASQKGAKTLAETTVNLAELTPLTLQSSPRNETNTYEMPFRGGKQKGTLQVESRSEWRKVNNKLVVRPDTGGSLSRKFTFAGDVDDPKDKKKLLKASSALKSMPNLKNLDPPRSDDESKYPLSARDNYSESSLNTAEVHDSLSSTSSTPSSSPPVSPTLVPSLPPSLTPRDNQLNINNNNNNNINNNNINNNNYNSNNNNNNNNNASITNNGYVNQTVSNITAEALFAVINSPRLVSPRALSPRPNSPLQISPRNNNLSQDMSPAISAPTTSTTVSTPIPIPNSSSHSTTNDEASENITRSEQQEVKKDGTPRSNNNYNTGNLKDSVGNESDKENDNHSEETEAQKAKEDVKSSDSSGDNKQKKEGDSTDTSPRHQIVLSSPENDSRKGKMKLEDITVTNLDGAPSTAVSPTLKDYDPYISDGDSDNDFEIHNAYTVNRLQEQIEKLQQERRQLELETFNLRKHLLHNEIYRPQALAFSERGIASTAEQIIENLLKMNCFQEPQNFLPSFFDSIIISLQQESQNEVEVPKILYWLSTTLGLLYLLCIYFFIIHQTKFLLHDEAMSVKGIPDPSVLGLVALTQPIKVDFSEDASDKENANLVHFASGVQSTGLVLYNRVLDIFIKELDDEKLVLAFLGRPKEKEEKRNFVIKEKPTHELTVKTPEPVLTSKMAIKEVVQEISENYELIRGAKIFETFAWHLVMHRTFCLDHLLVNEISTQKKLFSTDAQSIKQATAEVEHILNEKFPAQKITNPMKITNQYIALVTAEYSKLDSETFISSSFTNIKPSQILQIMDVLRPDKDSRKPVPGSVMKLLQSMAKGESDKPPKVSPTTWHLSDELSKLRQVVH